MGVNVGIFDCNDLVICYAPPNLLSVMPGNHVMLRSGGPDMIVADVTPEGDAICQWMAEGELQRHTFSLECLTCFGAR
jgi:uncharacterized protein YodC (DUF2158 family)